MHDLLLSQGKSGHRNNGKARETPSYLKILRAKHISLDFMISAGMWRNHKDKDSLSCILREKLF